MRNDHQACSILSPSLMTFSVMLSENEIAEQLGLSRTPVREALIDLNRVKVVEVIPQRGSRISLIDYALVEQARFLRLVVEEGVCRLAASLPGDVSFSELDENLKLQRFYLDNPNPAKLFMQAAFVCGVRCKNFRVRNSLLHALEKVRLCYPTGLLIIW